MGKSAVSNCTKYSLFVFNFIFWLAGGLLLGAGIYAQMQKSSDLKPISSALDFLLNPAILLIVFGAVIFIVAFFGCLGALRENVCLLKAYQILLTILLVLQILAVSLMVIFYFVPSVKKYLSFLDLEPTLQKAIVRYRDDLDLKDTIDSIQKSFECCGVSNDEVGYQDWDLNVYFNCSQTSGSAEKCGVPYSCCKEAKEKEDQYVNHQCGYGVRDPAQASKVGDVIWVKGCIKGFGDFFISKDNLKYTAPILAGVIGVIVLQIISVCMVRSFVDQVKQQQRKNKY